MSSGLKFQRNSIRLTQEVFYVKIVQIFVGGKAMKRSFTIFIDVLLILIIFAAGFFLASRIAYDITDFVKAVVDPIKATQNDILKQMRELQNKYDELSETCGLEEIQDLQAKLQNLNEAIGEATRYELLTDDDLYKYSYGDNYDLGAITFSDNGFLDSPVNPELSQRWLSMLQTAIKKNSNLRTNFNNFLANQATRSEDGQYSGAYAFMNEVPEEQWTDAFFAQNLMVDPLGFITIEDPDGLRWRGETVFRQFWNGAEYRLHIFFLSRSW